jgi:hypothetical protein
MKQIQPVIFPLNLGTATILNCLGNDNFSTSINIYYQLLTEIDYTSQTETGKQLQSGNLLMSGFDYEAYNTSPDGNEFIYNWTAQQIGVTLI